MKIELVQRILEAVPGVRKEGPAFLVPEEVEVSVFVALPSEVLTLPKLVRIELSGDLLIGQNQKGERFYFSAADVAGLKSAAGERRTPTGAGFR